MSAVLRTIGQSPAATSGPISRSKAGPTPHRGPAAAPAAQSSETKAAPESSYEPKPRSSGGYKTIPPFVPSRCRASWRVVFDGSRKRALGHRMGGSSMSNICYHSAKHHHRLQRPPGQFQPEASLEQALLARTSLACGAAGPVDAAATVENAMGRLSRSSTVVLGVFHSALGKRSAFPTSVHRPNLVCIYSRRIGDQELLEAYLVEAMENAAEASATLPRNRHLPTATNAAFPTASSETRTAQPLQRCERTTITALAFGAEVSDSQSARVAGFQVFLGGRF